MDFLSTTERNFGLPGFHKHSLKSNTLFFSKRLENIPPSPPSNSIIVNQHSNYIHPPMTPLFFGLFPCNEKNKGQIWVLGSFHPLHPIIPRKLRKNIQPHPTPPPSNLPPPSNCTKFCIIPKPECFGQFGVRMTNRNRLEERLYKFYRSNPQPPRHSIYIYIYSISTCIYHRN